MEEVIQSPYSLICHTLGCENAECVIHVMANLESLTVIICGPCSQPIIDITLETAQ